MQFLQKHEDKKIQLDMKTLFQTKSYLMWLRGRICWW